MISKEVCLKCPKRKKLSEEFYGHYLEGSSSKMPDFKRAWEKYNIVICPLIHSYHETDWKIYRLPVSSSAPPNCVYILEHVIDGTAEEDTFKSIIPSPTLGVILEFPCPKCESNVVLIRNRNDVLIWECSNILCNNKTNADQKTGKPINVEKWYKY